MEAGQRQPQNGEQTPEAIQSLPYYFPNLKTINEVVAFLSPYIDQDGCFVVRNSVRRQGSLTISVVQGGGVKHINIGTHKGMYFLTNRKFTTVADLVKHYSEYEVPNRENISKVCLTKPLDFKDFDLLTLEPRGWSPSWTPTSHPQIGPRPAQPTWASSPIQQRAKGPVTGKQVKSSPQNDTESASEQELFNIMTRPPPPLPHYYSTRQRFQYAVVRDTDIDHSADLIAQLAESEAAVYTDTCECGLLIEDAELPMGWTVHLTKPGEHERKAFFVTPTMESCWRLPKNIENMVSSRQKAMLKDLGVI